MQVLRMSQAKLDAILAHVTAELPHEGCGVLAGSGNEVLDVIPVKNVSLNPAHHYELDPIALGTILPTLDRRGLELLGFYHSHPEGAPIPSTTDIREATYPNTAYVIVGFRQRKARMAAWLINYGEVRRIAIEHDLPSVESEKAKPLLSEGQKFTLIVSGVIAILALLAISITLLPPAPAIP